MSKFKSGDRVRNMVASYYVKLDATGTVDQDDNKSPWVIWDDESMCVKTGHGTLWAQDEDDMELIE
jgi:hypothetical protein